MSLEEKTSTVQVSLKNDLCYWNTQKCTRNIWKKFAIDRFVYDLISLQ